MSENEPVSPLADTVPESTRPPGDARRTDRATIHRPMVALKAAHASNRTTSERIAVGWTRLAGSTTFLLLHLIWFTVWITWNTHLLPIPAIDPFPFGLLAPMIVSLEAIFLSIFVLIGQSREAAVAELRDELTLQINLRIEAEVTKSLQLVAGLYTRMGHRFSEDDELRNVESDGSGRNQGARANGSNQAGNRAHLGS